MSINNADSNSLNYINLLVNALQINIEDFMLNVYKGEQYDTVIYFWTMELYESKVPFKKAIDILIKRRMALLLAGSEHYFMDHREEHIFFLIMSKLKLHQDYELLEHDEKEDVQMRAKRLVRSHLYDSHSIFTKIFEVINLYNINKKEFIKNV